MDENNRFFERFRQITDAKYERRLGELAEKANVPYASLQNYRHGHHYPSVPALVALADALNVSIDWLCGRK